MFNWFKKNVSAVKVKPKLEVADDAITESAISESNAFKNQGNVHLNNGKLIDAAECYRQAIACNPCYAEAYSNLGLVFEAQGNLEEAVRRYRKALEFSPRLLPAHQNLGFALLNLGQSDAAEESLRRVIELDPEHAAALQSLGVIAAQRGEFPQAETLLRRALELQPDYGESHSNLANVLKRLGKFEDAVTSYRRALQIKPDVAETHYNLGNALQELGQFAGAVASYHQALELKPDYAGAHNNLGNALKELGQIDAALVSFLHALKIKPDFADAYNNLLLTLNYTAAHAPSHYLEQAHQFGRVAAEKATCFSAWQCVKQPERLRVGLVSGDLRKHSVGYFLEGFLEQVDPARIELVAYPTHHEEDELTARIRPYFSAWKSLGGKSDEEAARMIYADGVHILFDLSNHTAHNRLPVFAWKPAPVQVSWLGLPSTTGMAEMDYVLGDSHAIPAEFESHFSETVWRMPETCLCLTIPASTVNVVPLPALSTGYVTFGSFNNLTKMTDEVVAVWARILKSVPGSRLLLKTKQLHDPGVCENTRQRFASCGIPPERVLLSGILASTEEHLAMYNKVDIALDTFPYPGVTTSVEALWMGVPVLSLRGDRFLSRTAGSIAYNAGLPDWIAADADEYMVKAVAFASNLESLATLRKGLRQQVLACPLFDAPRFARHFESALDGMWQKWCDEQKPEGEKLSLSQIQTVKVCLSI